MSDHQITDARTIFETSLRLLSGGDAEGWTNLFAEGGVLEFPFAPDGWPTRFDGRAAIWAHMQKFPDYLSVTFSTPVYVDTSDPAVVVAQYEGSGSGPNGAVFRQRYLAIVTVRNGLVESYVDYWNPLRHLEALGGHSAAEEIVKS